MAYWTYNGRNYPELPDWASEYEYVTIHDPNLGDRYLVATNEIVIEKHNNITYGTWHDTMAKSGVKCFLISGSWGEPFAIEDAWIKGQSPYKDHSYDARWSNKDIYCADDDGSQYIILNGTAPVDPETGEKIIWPPIPVNPLDPTSLLQGYLVGCKLRALRGKKAEDVTIATLKDGVLYIQKAPAVLAADILEVK